MNVSTTAELVSEIRIRGGSQESCLAAIEVIAVFDHDYACHVLVQEWEHFADEPQWEYSLWLIDGNGATRVHRFSAPWPKAPLVAAAQLADHWRQNER